MRTRRIAGLLTATVVANVLGICCLSGCGGSGENTQVQIDKPVSETLSDSMDYMKKQMNKKGASKKR